MQVSRAKLDTKCFRMGLSGMDGVAQVDEERGALPAEAGHDILVRKLLAVK